MAYSILLPTGIPPGICTIESRESKKDLQRYKDVLEQTGGRAVPSWLTSDQENLKGEVLSFPNRSDIDVPVNEMLIVELYSK